ncbi:hypothetical protein [uncultured Tolumonas sp.]|jgi:hypothetical protein|uniref:hypothetical protein n=1 Tax=uncultured Tolumonas sp. TaxID=263765 RepID=UPI00293173AF|nr:hypothetical protein [uncultured Tolumonas sp.]
MLHSLPALLDELERRLMAGEDPIPLVGSIRWPDVIDWPRDRQEALRMRSRLSSISALINGLQAPLQATLLGLCQSTAYKPKGGVELPSTISLRIQDCV